jgi:hypothetical protein
MRYIWCRNNLNTDFSHHLFVDETYGNDQKIKDKVDSIATPIAGFESNRASLG